MAKLISKIYGEALFELAVEEDKVDDLLSEITIVQSILKDNADFGKLMNHPKILKEEKVKIMSEVLKGRVSDELTGFMNLVIIKDRYNEIHAILDYFLMEVKKLKGIGVAYVITPTELSEVKRSDVEERLLATTGYKKMEMHYQIDTALIGGMVIRIGDRVVDGSVSTKLSDLKKSLMQVQI